MFPQARSLLTLFALASLQNVDFEWLTRGSVRMSHKSYSGLNWFIKWGYWNFFISIISCLKPHSQCLTTCELGFCLLGSPRSSSSRQWPPCRQCRPAPLHHADCLCSSNPPFTSRNQKTLPLITQKCWNMIFGVVVCREDVMLLQLIACLLNVSLHFILFNLLIACP